jgi:hypothetical protein
MPNLANIRSCANYDAMDMSGSRSRKNVATKYHRAERRLVTLMDPFADERVTAGDARTFAAELAAAIVNDEITAENAANAAQLQEWDDAFFAEAALEALEDEAWAELEIREMEALVAYEAEAELPTYGTGLDFEGWRGFSIR